MRDNVQWIDIDWAMNHLSKPMKISSGKEQQTPKISTFNLSPLLFSPIKMKWYILFELSLKVIVCTVKTV